MYDPICNDRLVIDGREVYQGKWCGTSQIVEDRDVWAVAVALMREVDAYNEELREASRQRSLERDCERDDAYERIVALIEASTGETWE